MNDRLPCAFKDDAGLTGQVVSRREDGSFVLRLEEGQSLTVPGELLEFEGRTVRFRGNLQTDHFERETIPILREEADVHKREVERGGVRLVKRVHTRNEDVDLSRSSEEVQVERVAVNREAEELPEPRYDGNVLVIPVVREIVTIQKKFLVTEEIRIEKRSELIPHTERVELREEQIKVVPIREGDRVNVD